MIILSEISQREKYKYHMISFIYGLLKYDTNELMHQTETDPQRTDLWLPRRGQMEEG